MNWWLHHIFVRGLTSSIHHASQTPLVICLSIKGFLFINNWSAVILYIFKGFWSHTILCKLYIKHWKIHLRCIYLLCTICTFLFFFSPKKKPWPLFQIAFILYNIQNLHWSYKAQKVWSEGQGHILCLGSSPVPVSLLGGVGKKNLTQLHIAKISIVQRYPAPSINSALLPLIQPRTFFTSFKSGLKTHLFYRDVGITPGSPILSIWLSIWLLRPMEPRKSLG